ncbi:hypothetical protein PQX77_012424 [Marasmius sp. AFHP31]|nr:hypothetical protein PQX77_012424 [Marasmius sp. AFHP31]
MESYISTASTFGASYTPDVQDSTRIATDRILKNRKTWKTLKSNKECVWSPEIEAALIEGLEKYRPASSTDPLTLKRFPKRNRWISEHILRATGTLRSPKQVGSRLQQLRDTCKDDRILKLLSRRQYTPEPESPVCSDKGSSFPSSSTASSPCLREFSSPASRVTTTSVSRITNDVRHAEQRSKGRVPSSISPTHTSVYIELNPPPTLHQSRPRTSSPDSGCSSHALEQIHDPVTYENDSRSLPSTCTRLPIIDTSCKEVTVYNANLLSNLTAPTVSFTSPLLVTTSDFMSCFAVSLRGSVVYTESTELVLESTSCRGSEANVEYSHLYVSSLAPQFWNQFYQLEPDQICQYSIIQRITRRDSARCDAQGEMKDDLLSLSYHFRSPSPPLRASLSPTPALKEESPIIGSLTQPLSQSQWEDRHPANGLQNEQTAGVPERCDNMPLMYPPAEESSAHQLVAPSESTEGGYHGVEQSEIHRICPYETINAVLPDDGHHLQQQVSYADHHGIPVLRRSHSPDSLGLDTPLRQHPSSIPPPEFVLPLSANGHVLYAVPTIDLRTGMAPYFWDHSQSFHVPNATQVVSGYPATDTGVARGYDHTSVSGRQYTVGTAQAQQYHASSNAADVSPSPYEAQAAWIHPHENEYQLSSQTPAYSTTCMRF